MLNNASIQSFVPISDFAVTEKFYAGTLGLNVVLNNGFALILSNAAGQVLRCVLAPGASPQPFTILGWEVEDIKAAAADLKKHPIQTIRYPHFNQDQDGIWTAPNGDQVLWFNDPDGNVLSLAQHVGAGADQ